MALQTNFSVDEVVSAARSPDDKKISFSFIILCPQRELGDETWRNLEHFVSLMDADVYQAHGEERSCISFLSPGLKEPRKLTAVPMENNAQQSDRVRVHKCW